MGHHDTSLLLKAQRGREKKKVNIEVKLSQQGGTSSARAQGMPFILKTFCQFPDESAVRMWRAASQFIVRQSEFGDIPVAAEAGTSLSVEGSKSRSACKKRSRGYDASPARWFITHACHGNMSFWVMKPLLCAAAKMHGGIWIGSATICVCAPCSVTRTVGGAK